jgi:ATP phosphoribosyltransferase
MSEQLTIALSKGRIFRETLPLLAYAGIEPLDDPETSRKLILDTNQDQVKLVIIRASDVPTYVQYGAADLGVAGKDVLMEHGGAGLYEPLDLRIACCRLMVAGREPWSEQAQRLRIASKYVNSAKQYFAGQGMQVGLADLIVDVVDTGNTLRANGLKPLEKIADISSRLVVNKASMKRKHAQVQGFIELLAEAVRRQQEQVA